MAFEQSLRFGQAGESVIASWLRSLGNAVFPAYEIINFRKGPRIFTPSGELISPDFLVFNTAGPVVADLDGARVAWVETKRKDAFTFHRNSDGWQTGIDAPYFEDYLKVEQETPWPVWLFFLHEGGQAKDSPPNSPCGLYVNKLSVLRENVHHRDSFLRENAHCREKVPMVYWAKESLILLRDLPRLQEEIRQFKLHEVVINGLRTRA
jgi:hypothetical protein